MEQSRIQLEQWQEQHRASPQPHHHKEQLMKQYRHYRELRAKTLEIDEQLCRHKKTTLRRQHPRRMRKKEKEILSRLERDLKTRDLDQVRCFRNSRISIHKHFQSINTRSMDRIMPL